MTDAHKAAEARLQAGIRRGAFVAQKVHVAIAFQAIRIRDGVPRPVCVQACMPALQAGWTGSGYRNLHFSLS